MLRAVTLTHMIEPDATGAHDLAVTIPIPRARSATADILRRVFPERVRTDGYPYSAPVRRQAGKLQSPSTSGDDDAGIPVDLEPQGQGARVGANHKPNYRTR